MVKLIPFGCMGIYLDKLSSIEVAKRLKIRERNIKRWTVVHSIPHLRRNGCVLFDEEGVHILIQLHREAEKRTNPKVILWLKKRHRQQKLSQLTEEYEKSLHWYRQRLKNSQGLWDAINKAKAKPINIATFSIDRLFFEEY